MKPFTSLLVQIAFGWPAIVAVAAFSTYGLVGRRATWLLVAAVCSLGPSFYLFGTPLFRDIGLLFPFLFVAAGWAVARHRSPQAVALAVVPFLVVGPRVGSMWSIARDENNAALLAKEKAVAQELSAVFHLELENMTFRPYWKDLQASPFSAADPRSNHSDPADPLARFIARYLPPQGKYSEVGDDEPVVFLNRAGDQVGLGVRQQAGRALLVLGQRVNGDWHETWLVKSPVDTTLTSDARTDIAAISAAVEKMREETGELPVGALGTSVRDLKGDPYGAADFTALNFRKLYNELIVGGRRRGPYLPLLPDTSYIASCPGGSPLDFTPLVLNSKIVTRPDIPKFIYVLRNSDLKVMAIRVADGMKDPTFRKPPAKALVTDPTTGETQVGTIYYPAR